MAVNHFLLSDEQLIQALVELVENNTLPDERKIHTNEYPDYMRYDTRRNVEYWEIRTEILDRMKK